MQFCVIKCWCGYCAPPPGVFAITRKEGPRALLLGSLHFKTFSKVSVTNPPIFQRAK